MNKIEEQYAWDLEIQKREGKILDWNFEQVKLQLTKKQPGTVAVLFIPDFFIVLPDGSVRIDELKGGFVREDADLKFKLATELFPFFHWRMISIRKGERKILRDVPRRLQGGPGFSRKEGR